jgi:hypothetical protein
MMTFEQFLHMKNRPKPDKSIHGKVKIVDVNFTKTRKSVAKTKK